MSTLTSCSCGKGIRNLKVLVEGSGKECSVCKNIFNIHDQCAKLYWKNVLKRKYYFDQIIFLRKSTKYLCELCRKKFGSLCHCGKIHNEKNKGTYIVICGGGALDVVLKRM